MISRRAFLRSVALGVLVPPLAADAQQPAKAPRIGLLSEFSPADSALWYEAFRQGLRNLGWVEGKNINIDYRYTEGRHDRLPGLAAELVNLRVDIIVTVTTPVALAAKNATRTIPIVMASVGVDPVGAGLVESLARPGGNITGLSQMVPELVGKRLELLREMDPKLSRVAVLWDARDPSATLWKEMQLPARALGVQLHSLEVRSPKDLDRAFEDATRARAGAVVITPSMVSATNLKRIADLAAKSRLPSIYHRREFADSGGLIAYGVDRSDMFRRAATYVDKILKGAKPADLPVEQPTKFELVINLKTAQALGLTIPPSLLLRADQIIE